MVEPHLIINLMVPTQSVGLLIGKNGSAFRNINQTTGININFQSTDDIPDQNFQRVLCLRGENYTSVLTALSMVLEKLQQPRSVPGSSGPGFDEEESYSVGTLPSSVCFHDFIALTYFSPISKFSSGLFLKVLAVC